MEVVMDGSVTRDEWLRLMVELAETDRDRYRQIRAEAWDRVAKGHSQKTPEEISEWRKNAS
jgi:hypothetical protein